jgi:hypothetical protein
VGIDPDDEHLAPPASRLETSRRADLKRGAVPVPSHTETEIRREVCSFEGQTTNGRQGILETTHQTPTTLRTTAAPHPQSLSGHSVCLSEAAHGGEREMTEEALSPIGERMLFENEHVRVWENIIDPGEESPVHRHNHDYLAIEIEGDRVIHNPVKDGHFPRMEYDVTPGFNGRLRGGVTETAINIGASRFRTIIVELLDEPR